MKTNPLDDSTTVIALLPSENAKDILGNPVSLIIRFQSGITNVYIDWKDFLGTDRFHRVTYRFGADPLVTQGWSVSTDNQATFVPNDEVIGFIRHLLTVDTFVAQTPPYNANPVTAIFDVKNLENAIRAHNRITGWIPSR